MGTLGARRVVAAVLAISAAAALTGACGGSGTATRAAGKAPTASASPTPVSASSIPTSASGAASSPGASSGSADGPPGASGAAVLAQYAGGKSTVAADDVYPKYGDPATDVLHYGLDLRWDPAAKNLAGTTTLAVRAAKPTAQFVLDLASGLTADSVKVEGAVVPAGHDGDRLTVPLGRQLPVDGTVTVVIAYHGTPRLVAPPVTRPDIQGLGAQVTADGGLWAQQEPYGAFTWFPCNDQPSDKALYDVAITVPDGWAGVTGGTFAGRTEAADGFGVYRWHQPDPVSTYLVAFAVDRFKQENATGPHGLPITYWYLPADEEAVHRLTAKTTEMITFLEQRFGPYPFPTAGVVFPPGQVGMETQTMITLSAHLSEGDLLHEFAHQWFGDAVTPETWSGLWLNEGFAMYAQFMWQVAHGQAGAGRTLDDFMKSNILPVDQQMRRADGPPGHFLPTHFASTNVYYCPALMLHGLHDTLGDKAFYQLLNDWAHQHKGGNADRAEFIAFVKSETGKDFSAYINAWLDSPTTPTIRPGASGSGPAV